MSDQRKRRQGKKSDAQKRSPTPGSSDAEDLAVELAKAKMKVLAARLEAKKRKRGDEVKVEVVIPKRGAETAKRRKTGTAASVEASTVGEGSDDEPVMLDAPPDVPKTRGGRGRKVESSDSTDPCDRCLKRGIVCTDSTGLVACDQCRQTKVACVRSSAMERQVATAAALWRPRSFPGISEATIDRQIAALERLADEQRRFNGLWLAMMRILAPNVPPESLPTLHDDPLQLGLQSLGAGPSGTSGQSEKGIEDDGGDGEAEGDDEAMDQEEDEEELPADAKGKGVARPKKK